MNLERHFKKSIVQLFPYLEVIGVEHFTNDQNKKVANLKRQTENGQSQKRWLLSVINLKKSTIYLMLML